MARDFEVAPLAGLTRASALLLTVGLPLAGVAGALLKAAPGGPGALVLAQSGFGCALLAVPFVSALGNRRVRIESGRLRVEATWRSRVSPLSDFHLDEARIVDLREHPGLRPRPRFFALGADLPGLRTGDFRLRDGRKAFFLVSAPARVLVLPHADGRLWLLGVEKPQALLDAMRQGSA